MCFRKTRRAQPRTATEPRLSAQVLRSVDSELTLRLDRLADEAGLGPLHASGSLDTPPCRSRKLSVPARRSVRRLQDRANVVKTSSLRGTGPGAILAGTGHFGRAEGWSWTLVETWTRSRVYRCLQDVAATELITTLEDLTHESFP